MDSVLAVMDKRRADWILPISCQCRGSPRPSPSVWMVSGPGARFRVSQGLQHASAMGGVQPAEKQETWSRQARIEYE